MKKVYWLSIERKLMILKRRSDLYLVNRLTIVWSYITDWWIHRFFIWIWMFWHSFPTKIKCVCQQFNNVECHLWSSHRHWIYTTQSSWYLVWRQYPRKLQILSNFGRLDELPVNNNTHTRTPTHITQQQKHEHKHK